jgi:peptidoglycan/LPS O-acetylase OafA/YrhL
VSSGAYRQDIDGLRAVAVVPVLLFHAGIAPFGGGFVGVDVFFVISGYLITRILVAENTAGHFSLAGFYERRVRRIFPALMFTIALTVLATLLLLPAVDQKRVFDALAWLGIFASNIYFMDNSGYFDAATEHHPFLQTWSLAIEEQFYVVFPLALAALWRWRPAAVKWVLLGVALISLAWCLAIVDRDARSAFFSAPGRAWELLLGALLAVGLVPVLRAAWQREVMAAGGLLLIAGSVLLMTRDTVFPGLAALPPTLGAAMLIHAGQPAPDGSNHRAWASRLLEIRPAVFIGLISYSLYLLHWPLFAFAHGLHDGPMAIEVRLWLIAAAFALAVFSWKYVETPFRRPAQPMARQRLLMLAAGIMAITSFGAMGASHIAARQLGQSDQVAEAYRKLARAEPCMLPETGRLEDLDRTSCEIAGQGDRVIVWGDSYMAHYFTGFRDWAAQTGRPLSMMAMSSCAPIVGIEIPKRPACAPFNQAVLARILAQPPGTVVISAAWMVNEKKRSLSESFEGKLDSIDRQVEALRRHGSRVVVLGPGPVFPSPVPQIISSEPGGADGTAPASISRLFDRHFRKRAAEAVIQYLPVYELFCTKSFRCRYRDGKEWLFWDEGHFTQEGGSRVVRALPARVEGF